MLSLSSPATSVIGVAGMLTSASWPVPTELNNTVNSREASSLMSETTSISTALPSVPRASLRRRMKLGLLSLAGMVTPGLPVALVAENVTTSSSSSVLSTSRLTSTVPETAPTGMVMVLMLAAKAISLLSTPLAVMVKVR